MEAGPKPVVFPLAFGRPRIVSDAFDHVSARDEAGVNRGARSGVVCDNRAVESSTKGYNGGNGKQGEYRSEKEAVQKGYRPVNGTGDYCFRYCRPFCVGD